MSRYSYLLSFLLISFFCHSSWEKNKFDVSGVVTTEILSTSNEDSHYYDLGLNLSTVQLRDGWGFKANHLSQFSSGDTLSTNEQYSYIWGLDSRIFLSDAANFDLTAKRSSLMKTDGLFSTRNQDVKSLKYRELTKAFGSKVDLSKDSQFWKLLVEVGYTEKEREFVDGSSFLDDQQLFTSTETEWQISEDSHVGAKIVSVDTEQKISGQDVSVVNYYGSFKTRYFGASKLQIFIGTSKSSQDAASIFSWTVLHSTQITDDYLVSLLSDRTLTSTEDIRFNTSETTRHKLSANMKFSEVWGGVVEFDHTYETLSQSVKTERMVLNNKVYFKFSDNWTMDVSYSYDDYDSDDYGYQENKIAIKLFRDFV